jgi:hypothetical protein
MSCAVAVALQTSWCTPGPRAHMPSDGDLVCHLLVISNSTVTVHPQILRFSLEQLKQAFAFASGRVVILEKVVACVIIVKLKNKATLFHLHTYVLSVLRTFLKRLRFLASLQSLVTDDVNALSTSWSSDLLNSLQEEENFRQPSHSCIIAAHSQSSLWRTKYDGASSKIFFWTGARCQP